MTCMKSMNKVLKALKISILNNITKKISLNLKNLKCQWIR